MNAVAEAVEDVAAVADRLAVLLAAGVAPSLVWDCLAGAAGTGAAGTGAGGTGAGGTGVGGTGVGGTGAIGTGMVGTGAIGTGVGGTGAIGTGASWTGAAAAGAAATWAAATAAATSPAATTRRRASPRRGPTAGADRPGPFGRAAAALLARRRAGAPGDAGRMLRAAASAARDGGDVAAAILTACSAASDPASASARPLHGLRPARRAADPAPAARGWAALAAAWRVAIDAGAPLGPALAALAAALRDDAELERSVEAALAGPRASARLVQALPLVAVAFGLVLGFDTAGVLLGSPLGILCLLLGAGFLLAGRRWNRSLAAAAARRPVAPGLGCEFVAIAMAGGASVAAARERAERALDEFLPEADGDAGAIQAVLELGRRAGAPVAVLLRAEGARLRRTARNTGVLRAEALAVRLMVPLGVCILPAFALLGVAPLLISVVTGTLGAVP